MNFQRNFHRKGNGIADIAVKLPDNSALENLLGFDDLDTFATNILSFGSALNAFTVAIKGFDSGGGSGSGTDGITPHIGENGIWQYFYDGFFSSLFAEISNWFSKLKGIDWGKILETAFKVFAGIKIIKAVSGIGKLGSGLASIGKGLKNVEVSLQT